MGVCVVFPERWEDNFDHLFDSTYADMFWLEMFLSAVGDGNLINYYFWGSERDRFAE